MPLARPTSRIVAFALLPLLTVFSGCASYNRIADYPTPRQPTTIAIVAKPMSKMSELPIGVFYDEPRQIIISGHQKGLGWGMMFGLVGVLVANEANKSAAESRFGTTARGSVVDLGTLTREALSEELAAQPALPLTATAAPARLQLSPYALFTVLASGKARLYAMLRAEIPSPGGDPRWSVRYFVRAPGEYTIEGADGWMSQERFTTALRPALRRAIQVCLADTQGNLTGTKTIKALGVFPYLNTDKFELPFIVVQDGSESVVARLAAGDAMVMAGTHVLERADYKISDATFKDPRK